MKRLLKRGYDVVELLAAAFVIAEHIKTRTCRAKYDDVAGLGVLGQGHRVQVRQHQHAGAELDPGGAGRGPGEDGERVVVGALAEAVNACPDAMAVLVFPDGLTGNCTALLDAARTRLTRPVPILGGTSADAMALERTFLVQKCWCSVSR